MKLFFLHALVLALFLTACSTDKTSLVSNAGNGAREYIPLAPGAQVYMYADAARVQPILGIFEFVGVDLKQTGDMIKRTKSAAIGFYPEASGRRFIMAGQGSYPNIRAGLGMFFSPAWKKRRSATGDSYWYSEKYHSAVSMSADRVFASDGDPFAPAPGVAVPEGFSMFRRDAVLALWLDDAAAPLNKFIDSLGIPIEFPVSQLMLSLQESNHKYSALIRMETKSTALVKGLVAMVTIFRKSMPTTAPKGDPAGIVSLLFANSAESDGTYLILRTGELDASELALVVNLLTGK
jgi:hypothetical protein